MTRGGKSTITMIKRIIKIQLKLKEKRTKRNHVHQGVEANGDM